MTGELDKKLCTIKPDWTQWKKQAMAKLDIVHILYYSMFIFKFTYFSVCSATVFIYALPYTTMSDDCGSTLCSNLL